MAVDNVQYLFTYTLKKKSVEGVFNRILKRFFDIVFSLFVIVFILSWLLPVLYIFIKIESKGAAIFKQKRNGLNYEIFDCFKFRSMRVNNFSDKKTTIKGDERITKIGRFIRKTSIDELPQFFNVLKGEMTVVGPRPHMVSQTEMFKDTIYNFGERHTVKPGITGLAQVSGCRGEIKNNNDIRSRLKYDVFYIEKWSFYLDLKIILQTILQVFNGDERAI